MKLTPEIMRELCIDDMPNEDFDLLAARCGLDVAAQILEKMQGLTLFVPINGFKKFYARMILREFDGSTRTIKELALKYKITEGHIREILKGKKIDAPVEGQRNLFVKEDIDE